MTEEQKEAEADKMGTAYDDWYNSLGKKLERLESMTKILRKNWIRSQAAQNTKKSEAAVMESINII